MNEPITGNKKLLQERITMKHIDFSAVTHLVKGIPPFLILHVAGPPDVTAQARRLGAGLREAEIPARVFGARETIHNKLNANLGLPDDPARERLFNSLGLSWGTPGHLGRCVRKYPHWIGSGVSFGKT